MTSLQEPFALLDDASASDTAPTSRLYTGFVREHRCTAPAGLDATWAAVQADLHGPQGLHAVLLADYEWGARLIGAAHRPPPAASRRAGRAAGADVPPTAAAVGRGGHQLAGPTR